MTNSSIVDKIVLEVAVAIPLDKTFDFLSLEDTNKDGLEERIGCRVLVPFGRQQKVGIFLGIKEKSDVPIDKLKPIIHFLDDIPVLSKEIITLAKWSATYYHYPLGEVLHQCLPVILRSNLSFSEAKQQIQQKISVWKLTELGKTLDLNDFKRAKRQAELIKYLQQHPQGINKIDLDRDEKSGWQSVIKKLVDMAYVEKIISYSNNENRLLDDSKSLEQVLSLNDEQALAVTAMCQQRESFYAYLLYGITGSGKTEVYLQFIQSILDLGKQVLILVPEINLTPQLFERFKKRFNVPLATLHSSLNNKQRFSNWLQAVSGQAQIVIGTRSAIFTPMNNLAAIILDEEHDSSFKQQEGFRYHARDVAIVRARSLNIPIILGSATPSFESLANVEAKKYSCFKLTQRAGGAKAPKISILDVRNKLIDHGISHQLKSQIEQELENNNQIILFQNRRGYSPITYCHQCGWIAQCVSCDAKLTTHQGGNFMLCHHCDTKFPIPTYCLSCRSDQIEQLGAGTERIESSLQTLFPDVDIFRIDKDSTRGKDKFVEMIEKVKHGQRQILVGTQMLSKGHHFPNVTLVVILDLDQGLFSTDFRAMEKMAQLIVQVAGRAGREKKQGHVVLQTHQPEHPFYHQLLSSGYGAYAKVAMQDRKEMLMPPYWFLAMIRCDAINEQINQQFLQECLVIGEQLLAQQDDSSIQIIGPVPAPMQRKAGRFRSQLLIQAESRPLMQQFLTQWLIYFPSNHKVKWTLDVDPQDMS